MTNKAIEQPIDSDGEITENLGQIEPMERDGGRFNSQYDGIDVDFIAPGDEFVESDDDVRILPTNYNEEDEEIPLEVIVNQECIPVGCVSSAVVTAREGGWGVCPGGVWGCVQGCVCLGGVSGCVYPDGVSRGCVCVQGVCVQGVCVSRGCLSRRGVCPEGCVSIGGVCPGWCVQGVCPGVCVCPGVFTPVHALIHSLPLWTEWQMLVKILPCRNYVADDN